MNKFNTGEVVILQSISEPQKNGEYTVRAVLYEGSEYTCRQTNRRVRKSVEGASYLLEETFTLGVSEQGDLLECPWAESALRKKHDGSSFSFSQLMDTLKQPSLIDS